ELVVETLMVAFAEQMQVEIAQDRQEAVGILEVDHTVAEGGAKPIFLRTGQRAGEEAGIMDASQRRGLAVLTDHLDARGFRQKGAYDRLAAVVVQTEIAKRIGMPTFNDRKRLGRKMCHEDSLTGAGTDRTRSRLPSATRSQSGRWARSYSSAPTAFSSMKKFRRASAMCGSSGHRRSLALIS